MKQSEKLTITSGIIILSVAAVFIISILLQFLDFGIKFNSVLGSMQNFGVMLYSVYGLSCLLIPVYLIVASFLLFLPSWNIRRGIYLIAAIIPFFTVSIIEHLCKNIFNGVSFSVILIKYSAVLLISGLLVAIEYLIIGIIIDSIEIKRKSKKNDTETEDSVPGASKPEFPQKNYVADGIDLDMPIGEAEAISQNKKDNPVDVETYIEPVYITDDSEEEEKIVIDDDLVERLNTSVPIEDQDNSDENEFEEDKIEESDKSENEVFENSNIVDEMSLVEESKQIDLNMDYDDIPKELPEEFSINNKQSETAEFIGNSELEGFSLDDIVPGEMPTPEDMQESKENFEPIVAKIDFASIKKPSLKLLDKDIPVGYTAEDLVRAEESERIDNLQSTNANIVEIGNDSEIDKANIVFKAKKSNESEEIAENLDIEDFYSSEEEAFLQDPFKESQNRKVEILDEDNIVDNPLDRNVIEDNLADDNLPEDDLADDNLPDDNLPDDNLSDDDFIDESSSDDLSVDDSQEEDLIDDNSSDFDQVVEDPTEVIPGFVSVPMKKTGSYNIPVDGLLTSYQNNPYWIIDDETRQAGSILKDTLSEFKIEADVTGIRKGPVITMFEMLPAPGVKLNRIVTLQDNIALRLAASSVRIVAPIPGKHAVGIEVPNKERAVVSFRELIEKDLPAYNKMQIPVVLGKDISGDAQVLDLTATPHLLIAGSTGSGKSVCVNSIILSILYKRSFNDVKLILIDPKIVELKLYNDIPHLLTPVITEPKKAFQALQYCLCEMERRYAMLDHMGVRDIKSYNKRISERHLIQEKLPYIVIIIDEFADLMATTGKELESTVARLAAMSRAVGIHLVLATQRPSIDVITGLIKANIPTRIAFMVASKTDSRIIIDQVGAEKLLGKGDMLYASAIDPFPIRIQGTFVTEDEVENVVNYVKQYGEPDYIDEEIFVEEEDDESDESPVFTEGEDPLYEKALDIVVQAGKASASYIQRRLKIGYNRAARLVEEMEERGIVGPANGSKPREIVHIP